MNISQFSGAPIERDLTLPKEHVRSGTRGALGTETLHKIQAENFRASIKFTVEPHIQPYPLGIILAIWSAALLFCAAVLAGVGYGAWMAFEAVL